MKHALIATPLFVALMARIAFDNIGPVFWAGALISQILLTRNNRLLLVSVIGMFLNAAAVLANGSRMPVLLPCVGCQVPLDAFHTSVTSATRLRPLCDLWGGWSVGDMLLCSYLVATLVRTLVVKRRMRVAS